MRAMPPETKECFEQLLGAARDARGIDRDEVWRSLEDAHVLSQPWAGRHVRVHLLMLRQGVADADLREVLGQAARLVVAGPGSLTGRYPPGNTGRASVAATSPMPVRPELAALLPDDLQPEVEER